MSEKDFTPVSRVASDYDRIPPILPVQRRAWVREIEARFDGDERDELVAMLFGDAA